MSLKYTLHVVLTSLSHYRTFVFIIICYSTLSLAIFHSYRGENICIIHIEMKQGIIQFRLDII
jgi:nucleosome binding factor SPN SPT16 subunit